MKFDKCLMETIKNPTQTTIASVGNVIKTL